MIELTRLLQIWERAAHVDALKAEKANAEKVLTSSKGADAMKAAKDAEEKE